MKIEKILVHKILVQENLSKIGLKKVIIYQDKSKLHIAYVVTPH